MFAGMLRADAAVEHDLGPLAAADIFQRARSRVCPSEVSLVCRWIATVAAS